EELLAQQKACDAAPTLRCRSEVGQNALRLAQLPVARAQLNDARFVHPRKEKRWSTTLRHGNTPLKRAPGKNPKKKTPQQKKKQKGLL
ncbi:hypothetical protein KCA24_24800, partial [Escherichia coli]|nr:hypothetical protein [Escherichia coli]